MTVVVVVRVNGSRVMVMGERQVLIESRSNPGQMHTVLLNRQNEGTCTCTGWTVRKHCWHADTIRAWMLGRAEIEILPEDQPAVVE